MVGSQKKKEVILGVDYGDHIYLGYWQGELYGEKRIRNLIRLIANTGITTIYWRVSAVGKVTYRSKICTVLDGTNMSMVSATPAGIIMKQCDPLAVAIDEARNQGLKIYIYVTLFDESFPGGLESDFSKLHPEYCWKHRTEEHYIPGLLSYSYPAVRKYKIAQMRELIEYSADGLYLDVARSHSGIWPVLALPIQMGRDPHLYYGFNEPEVEEYKQRYGIDPCKDKILGTRKPDFDEEKWNKLRGEYLTLFISQVRELTQKANQNLAVGFYTDAECYLSPAGRQVRLPLGKFYIDWPTWVVKDLIDEMVIIAEHRRFGYKDWIEHSRNIYRDAREKNNKKVYIWAATEEAIDEIDNPPLPLPISIEKNREVFLKTLEQALTRCLRTDADGVYLYEAQYIEQYNYWDTIKKTITDSDVLISG